MTSALEYRHAVPLLAAAMPFLLGGHNVLLANDDGDFAVIPSGSPKPRVKFAATLASMFMSLLVEDGVAGRVFDASPIGYLGRCCKVPSEDYNDMPARLARLKRDISEEHAVAAAGSAVQAAMNAASLVNDLGDELLAALFAREGYGVVLSLDDLQALAEGRVNDFRRETIEGFLRHDAAAMTDIRQESESVLLEMRAAGLITGDITKITPEGRERLGL